VSDVSVVYQCVLEKGAPKDPVTIDSSSKRKYPLNVKIGVAYFPSSRFLFSFDISYYEGFEEDGFETEEVLNLAMGGWNTI
jgi:hypothetical protein